ncbi:3-oxoacyl-ACP synthase III family protein [Anditalea andensis]|uniref:3-oxoacyl-ACP synthase n=1 Tax=Anditalea andensis TaxID=1048983 RepID=A0A074KX60_9BACT|nr:ketoacyl-ACP synthase III [Anditalea andensis]KEO73544.1 3-oxoacyl-ACP synthase [Anditalea andensis]
MGKKLYSIIKGTGRYIPTRIIKNEDFLDSEFYDASGVKITKPNQEIIEKFQAITTITERRYVTDDLVTSDIGYFAAENALTSSGVDKESLDYIIVAHNFGDIKDGNRELDIVPSLAARVKYKLGIENPYTVAYDLPFGCPGWLQGMIQADYYIKSGDAKRVMVIGAEVLSRVCDPHDRDSMIYADGAGAVILEGIENNTPMGILAHNSRSDTILYSKMLYMGDSYNTSAVCGGQYLKMNGRKLYQYALETVPNAIKACLDKAGVPIGEVKKVLIHQANGKMDDEILKRLYGLYEDEDMPEDIMPMTISWLGNSSVATVPTLLDLILKDDLNPHRINDGDTIVFASVGAGMNINAAVYRF